MRDPTAAYGALVAARRSCRACNGLVNPSVVAAGADDRDGAIGPWSTWQGRLDSPLIVVGQDYSDVAYFERRRGIEDPANPTNLNLVRLLGSIGIEVSPPGAREGRASVFFTNAILCLKSGGMQARVKGEWFRECGRRFLRAQIELVPARAVVALGQRAYDAILAAFGLPREPLRQAITSPGTPLPSGATAIAVYHCGSRVTNTIRRFDTQLEDWQRVKAVLAEAATPRRPSGHRAN